MQIFLFIALFIAFIAAVFALQNSAVVQVTFLMWRFESSLAAVLLVTLAAGALISSLLAMPGSFKTRWLLRQQRKKMTELETRLAEVQAQLETVSVLQKENAPSPLEPVVPPALPAPTPQPTPDELVEDDHEF